MARSFLVMMLVTMVASAAGAVTGDQETFYFGIDGFPQASLVTNPTGGELPNFDRGRDVEPGLFLERTALGLGETDEARYQQWQGEVGERRIEGYPRLVLWAAPSRFNADVAGRFDAFLLDCNRGGDTCSPLGEAEGVVPAGSSDWSEVTVDFGPIDHRFSEGRHLGLRVIVPDSSESDLMLAYGYPNYRSRLTIFSELPAAVTVATQVAPPPVDAQNNSERMRRTVNVPLELDLPAASESPWSWLGTVVFSSVTLVVLGAFLMRGLTKPGRHEVRFVSRVSTTSRRETVSAR